MNELLSSLKIALEDRGAQVKSGELHCQDIIVTLIPDTRYTFCKVKDTKTKLVKYWVIDTYDIVHHLEVSCENFVRTMISYVFFCPS